MVVGGNPIMANSDVELIDLTRQGRKCKKPADITNFEIGSTGIYIKDMAIVCGGYAPSVSDCYKYQQEKRSWTNTTVSLVTPRAFASSTVIGDNQWWITGGFNSEVGYLKETEVLNDNFARYQDMLVERDHHNMVRIDSNRYMMLGGQSQFVETYNFNGSWSHGPNLSIGRHESHAGLVTFGNQTRMIVAAGGIGADKSVELTNVFGDEWVVGPDLPHAIQTGASVQLTRTFLIVGGFNGSRYLDTIWMFDTFDSSWTLLDQKLAKPRSDMAAFLVPDEYCHV